DEGTVAGATASMSSTAWVAAHFFAMAGFILMPLGLLALRAALAATRAEPLALTAAVLAWIGSGLLLPAYGAEDFGLHAIAGPAPPPPRPLAGLPPMPAAATPHRPPVILPDGGSHHEARARHPPDRRQQHDQRIPPGAGRRGNDHRRRSVRLLQRHQPGTGRD